MQERILGILHDDGTTIAFPVEAVSSMLDTDGEMRVSEITIRPDGGGFVAAGDREIATHEAFWFAWNQFRPDTLL